MDFVVPEWNSKSFSYETMKNMDSNISVNIQRKSKKRKNICKSEEGLEVSNEYHEADFQQNELNIKKHKYKKKKAIKSYYGETKNNNYNCAHLDNNILKVKTCSLQNWKGKHKTTYLGKVFSCVANDSCPNEKNSSKKKLKLKKVKNVSFGSQINTKIQDISQNKANKKTKSSNFLSNDFRHNEAGKTEDKIFPVSDTFKNRTPKHSNKFTSSSVNFNVNFLSEMLKSINSSTLRNNANCKPPKQKCKHKKISDKMGHFNITRIKKFKVAKVNSKKIFHLLHSQETSDPEENLTPVVTPDNLKQKLMDQINASQFRFINEKMYTSDSNEIWNLFKKDPNVFKVYHDGYKSQVSSWPLNPLDAIISWFKKKPKRYTVADFGCGEAKLASSIPQEIVYSLDLVALNPDVIVCDMARTPLETSSIDVAVFCLSLMCKNLKDFVIEANRVLKPKGIMKVAEVQSRIEDPNLFIRNMKICGFRCKFKDFDNKYFSMFDFIKYNDVLRTSKLPEFDLKPCLYKKR